MWCELKLWKQNIHNSLDLFVGKSHSLVSRIFWAPYLRLGIGVVILLFIKVHWNKTVFMWIYTRFSRKLSTTIFNWMSEKKRLSEMLSFLLNISLAQQTPINQKVTFLSTLLNPQSTWSRSIVKSINNYLKYGTMVYYACVPYA